ncbi:MAG: bifunctional sulfate adenylyltransferase/adenylylsulfate kinase [Jatrophihabitantaceae bacterium]
MTAFDLARPTHRALVDLVVDPECAAELKSRAVRWPSWTLSRRQLCDLGLLASGAFSPLASFLGQNDYLAVCGSMRLADGTLWPMPVTLDVTAHAFGTTAGQDRLALRDREGVLVAVLERTQMWRPDRHAEAGQVFGTTDDSHPGVNHVLHATHDWYVSGRLSVLSQPELPEHGVLTLTPRQVRAEFARRGWDRVVAFQTRNPLHRAHQQLTLRAAREADARLLIHPVVGIGKPGDVAVRTRVRCYRAIMPSYPDGTAMLSLLPLAMRMGGPREALWHALIRGNYGATHFIVGRDHASPGADAHGRPFYAPYEAQDLLAAHDTELEVKIVPFRRMVYRPDTDSYCADDEVPPGTVTRTISGTELRQRLAAGRALPTWFTPPAVAAELRRCYPAPAHRGLTVFFTGLSGAGKSTIANHLCASLEDRYGRNVTLLDGDVIRQHLSADLGFGRRDREENLRRVAFVAGEVTRHRGVAVCATIAPYAGIRADIRRTVEQYGGFVLVYVATPLDECERRDRKGLYAKARAGLLPQFTGVSDDFDEPEDADIVIDTQVQSPAAAADSIIEHLGRLGYLPTRSKSGEC